MPGRTIRTIAARFLLSRVDDTDAIKTFRALQQGGGIFREARQAGLALIVEGERFEPRRKTFVYVNNRLEGNALESIRAMTADLPRLLEKS